jgi:hypothetical protein
MPEKFIALGCSLTAVVGWTRYFSQELKLDLVDLSEGSSSNLSQIIKLKNYLLSANMLDKLANVVLLWQVTSPGRSTSIIEKSFGSKPYRNSHPFPGHQDVRDFFTYNLKFDKKEVMGLLSHNPYFDDPCMKLHSLDAQFEQVIFDIVLLSKLVKRTVIWYGWKDLDRKDRLRDINSFLAQQDNITLLPMEHSIVDWCRANNLEFFDDGEHPKSKSSIQWGKQILLPVLQKILPNFQD